VSLSNSTPSPPPLSPSSLLHRSNFEKLLQEENADVREFFMSGRGDKKTGTRSSTSSHGGGSKKPLDPWKGMLDVAVPGRREYLLHIWLVNYLNSVPTNTSSYYYYYYYCCCC